MSPAARRAVESAKPTANITWKQLSQRMKIAARLTVSGSRRKSRAIDSAKTTLGTV